MVSVAALGFGDIPTKAFMNAVNMVEKGVGLPLTLGIHF